MSGPTKLVFDDGREVEVKPITLPPSPGSDPSLAVSKLEVGDIVRLNISGMMLEMVVAAKQLVPVCNREHALTEPCDDPDCYWVRLERLD